MMTRAALEALSESELIAELVRFNRVNHEVQPKRAGRPDQPGWWVNTRTNKWYFARLGGMPPLPLRLELLGPSRAESLNGDRTVPAPFPDPAFDCWSGPHLKRLKPWKLELVRVTGKTLYLPIPADRSYDAGYESMLIHRYDGGDCDCPVEPGEILTGALYAEANTNDLLITGDEVWLDGKRIGHFDLPHFIPESE